MKRSFVIGFIAYLFVLLTSCSAKDDSNALINTQFATEISDSNHIFSPKTYSYLHNIKPPLGVKPVVVAVDQIDNSEIGTFADDIFDLYCKKKYSGNTFRQRGILIIASKNPELIQVRVGKAYAVYCRMRGSAAGANYLSMQKEVAERGFDELCPVALNNVLRDIEESRELSWYKKVALKVSSIHVEMFLDDVATPSESFFSQFYFRPFLFLVGWVKSIFGNWTLSFLFIAVVYIVTKSRIEDKLRAYINRKARENSSSNEDYHNTLNFYFLIYTIIVFLIKLVITVPTLAAISVLSTSRMEDIIALQNAHIPSVSMIENVTQWSNITPALWLVLLMMAVYYIKFLFCIKGYFTYGHLSDIFQKRMYQNSEDFRYGLDSLMLVGYNRNMIQRLFSSLFSVALNAIHIQNFHEITDDYVQNDQTETDDDGKPKKRLIDLFFLDTDDPLYHQSPALALQVNTHREAICLTFFVGLIATAVLSYTYVVYFTILWTVQLVYRVIMELLFVRKIKIGFANINPLRLIKKVWSTDIIFLVGMIVLFFVLSPSYTPKTTESIAEVQNALPDDFSGLYFVPKADGENVKGVTARMMKDETDNYIMQIYSDKPVRRFALTLDKEVGMFHSDVLGDGYIIFDKQSKSIHINFSDLWILTN